LHAKEKGYGLAKYNSKADKKGTGVIKRWTLSNRLLNSRLLYKLLNAHR
jgi:hypothetical protein